MRRTRGARPVHPLRLWVLAVWSQKLLANRAQASRQAEELAMGELVAAENGWRFEIIGGVNEGARMTLPPGRYRLGSSAANDVVLADPTVAAEHAAIDLSRGRGMVAALAPDVRLQGKRLAVGRRHPLKPGSVLALGAARLSVVSAAPPAPRSATDKAGRGRTMLLTAILLLSAGTIGFVLAYRAASPVSAAAGARVQGEVRGPAAGAPATVSAAIARFRSHLAAVGLTGVTLVGEGGAALARGSLPPQESAAWLGAEQWFDATMRGRYLLIDRVATADKAALPELDIAAVAMTPVPNIVTSDGEHYLVGSVLQGGWSIVRIAPRAVILRDGGRELRIAL